MIFLFLTALHICTCILSIIHEVVFSQTVCMFVRQISNKVSAFIQNLDVYSDVGKKLVARTFCLSNSFTCFIFYLE